MGVPGEGEQVVLTDGVEGNLLDDNHLFVFGFDHPLKVLGGVHVYPFKDLLQHSRHPEGSLPDPLPLRILTDPLEDHPDSPFYLFPIEPFLFHALLLLRTNSILAENGGVCKSDRFFPLDKEEFLF